MAKQNQHSGTTSSLNETKKSQGKDVLYLSKSISAGKIEKKKVIINEAVTITSPLVLQDCEIVFGEDPGKKDRGCLHLQNSNLEIKGGHIHYEPEHNDASASFLLSKAGIKLEGVKTDGAGPLIDTDASSVINLKQCTFENIGPDFIAQSRLSGGEQLEVHIQHCTFKQNSSVQGRKPLLNISHIQSLKINASAFQNLNFPLMNIRLYSTERKIEIIGTTFTDCKPADYLIRVNGGYGTALLIDGCTFSGCSALYFADDPIEIKNSVFNQCSAVKNSYSGGMVEQIQGGAIHFDCYDYGKIENCKFNHCTAVMKRKDLLTTLSGSSETLSGDGGAIYIDVNPYHAKDVQITNCEFISCTAAEKGGAICVTQDGKTKKPMVAIDMSRFFNCEAKTGSAIHHIPMVSGENKWNTQEWPFVAAKLNNVVYENCEAVSLETIEKNDTGAYGQGNTFVENTSRIALTLAQAAEVALKSKGKPNEERSHIMEKITALEEKLTALEEPEEQVKIERQLAELEQKAETLEVYSEIKEDTLALLETLVSDFKAIFQ